MYATEKIDSFVLCSIVVHSTGRKHSSILCVCFAKNEPRVEKAEGGLLVCVWVSGAIHSVSHVFLDISAYTENDT